MGKHRTGQIEKALDAIHKDLGRAAGTIVVQIAQRRFSKGRTRAAIPHVESALKRLNDLVGATSEG